ncbi:MAG: caspase family protein [Cytophagaceae bacterium]|nr:caspase family protein [Gemmatimonadaceae bacterium]
MPEPSPFAHSIAVVVGIDRYGHGIPELRTAANDARRVAQTLADGHGYEVIQLIDSDASHERLTALLTTELPARVGPDDRVLFYWAGHGVALDGDTGPNGYLLPSDARRGEEQSFLHMPLVHDALVSLPCRHMLVVLDSCFSGAFRWSGTRSIERVDEVIHQEKYDRYVHDAAWQVITSASQDQKALDQLSAGSLGSRDGEGAHSPFALALFKALEGGADVMGGRDGDGLVTAMELFVYLDEELQAAAIHAGTRQTPGLWPLRKHDKGQFVFFVPGRDLTLPPAPPLTFENNPWRGLASYEREDAGLFFGRDKETAALRTVIAQRSFVAVLGASGTGKSSLLKAGVLPHFDADPAWHILPVIRPAGTPIPAIADSIATLNPSARRPTNPADVAAAVAAWCRANPARRLLMIVDQCEELVTMARATGDRDTALQLLASLLDSHGDQLRIVITLRTDFEPQFDRSVLASRWKEARFVVPPMSRGDMQAVIEQPAAKRVVYFDPPGLVDTLLDEVANTPGALPLLSFALSEMYVRYIQRRATDRALTAGDYDALGGVVGALRSRADEEYDALDALHQATMQRVMLRMVGSGGGNLAKRRVLAKELEYPDPAENERVQVVRRRLTEARLVVEGREFDGDAYVEPAHDALVRAWGRLINWIQQAGGDAIPLVTRQKLGYAAAEWSKADKAMKGGLLWSDPVRSAMLAPVVKKGAPWLNVQERDFARRSVRGRRNARWVSRGVTVLVALLGVASMVGLMVARRNAKLAAERSVEATAAAERAEAEKVRAVRSLFTSLKLYMRNGNAGSICVRSECGVRQPNDGRDWISISRLPDGLRSVKGWEDSRDFIVAREHGEGHVLVYAHDGLTSDREIQGRGADNLVFAENALRWLAVGRERPGCPSGTRILYWQGTYVPIGAISLVDSFIVKREWSIAVARPDSLADQLRCTSVLWYSSDWNPPQDFVTTHVPLIEQFVRDGGGLLVGGLGWSFAEFSGKTAYAADSLGKPFGFAFTVDAFEADPNRPLPLLSGR